MKLVLDRFEGEYAVAVLDDGRTANIPAFLLENAAEGDVIEIRIDENETQSRKERINKKIRNLFDGK